MYCIVFDRTSILLHSGLNPAWHFWLSTRFSCCLKMKSVENILRNIWEQFYRFSRGCKLRENRWNCSRNYTEMYKTDSFLGNKKLSLNQNVAFLGDIWWKLSLFFLPKFWHFISNSKRILEKFWYMLQFWLHIWYCFGQLLQTEEFLYNFLGIPDGKAKLRLQNHNFKISTSKLIATSKLLWSHCAQANQPTRCLTMQKCKAIAFT